MRDFATWLKPLTRVKSYSRDRRDGAADRRWGARPQTRAEFRAPTQQLTTTANAISEISKAFFQPPQPPATHMEHIHVCVCRQNTHTH